MSYPDLPLEVWEHVISVADPVAAAQLLATNRTFRQELLPAQSDRLEAARTEHLLRPVKEAAQKWLADTAVELMIFRTFNPRNPIGKGLIMPANISARLSSAFPRITTPQGEVRAVASLVSLYPWFWLYIYLNHLGQGDRFLVDEFLAEVTASPVGTVMPFLDFNQLLMRKLLSPKTMVAVDVEQQNQIRFAQYYLLLINNLLTLSGTPTMGPLLPNLLGNLTEYEQIDPG